jgi:protein O-GlcNAc transferase
MVRGNAMTRAVEAARLFGEGLACQRAGDFLTAAARYRDAIACVPGLAEAHANLGSALLALGQVKPAAQCLETALSLKRTQPGAWLALGLARQALGDARAGRALRAALMLEPASTLALRQLGFGQRALAIDLADFDGLVDLASRSIAAGRRVAAGRAARRAVALAPERLEGHGNLGILMQEQGDLDPAARIYRRGLALAPIHAGLWNNLANALTDIHAIVAAYRRAVELAPTDLASHSNLLFALNYLPDLDCDALFAEYQAWEARHAAPHYEKAKAHANSRDPDRPLRIGYLSADFRSNPIAHNVIGLLETRDRSSFHSVCYGEVAREDEVTRRYRATADAYRSTIGLSDDQVAELIRADGIDILFVMAGHTAHNRLLVCARKPAPVQIAYGDLSTTGLATMDWWLTDPIIHPEDTRERFTEKLLRIPLLVLHEPPPEAPAVGPLPARAAGFITFGSCNNAAKLNDRVFALWAQVLAAVPGSRLLLKYVNWFGNESARARIRSAFARRGVDPDRIVFDGERLPRARHLEILNRIDIALDPFPFNGCTTTFEALWMGVPVVTLAGERWLGRMGVGTLAPLGLEHLAAADEGRYVALATALANDLDGLAALRAGLRGRVAASPLVDATAYARSVERAFRSTWRDWCRA